MQKMDDETAPNVREKTFGTYGELVATWAQERELLREVAPCTARKSAQKAMLFGRWIGTLVPDEVDSRQITLALCELGRSGGRKGAGLSSATLRAAHLAGSQAYSWGISLGAVSSNPFSKVPRPKANYRQSRFLTMPQATKLTKLMVDNFKREITKGNMRRASFSLAVCIALSTGLRRGEIFALTWDDFDEGVFRLSIAKAVKADGIIGAPKTVSGIRSVAVGYSLSNLLAEFKEWQRSQLLDTEAPLPRSILCDSDGSRPSMDSFEHWWRKWADRNGFEKLRFHELRHTHATLLISRGVDIKTVQMRLGHSSADITMSCYAHAIPLSDGAAAVSLDSTLFCED